MSETKYKNRVLKILKKELPGAWIYKVSDRFVSGIPDIFILYRGQFAAIELKVGDNPVTRLQEHTLTRLAAAGAITKICRDSATEDGIAQIRSVVAAIKARVESGIRTHGAQGDNNEK